MLIGIGTDIVDNSRMLKHKDDMPFLRRIFNDEEIRYICSPSSQLAARFAEKCASHFAAKEAFFKALSSGLADGFRFKDLSVLHEPGGRPYIEYSSKVPDYLGIAPCELSALLSISHERGLSLAFVTLQRLARD